MYFRFSYIFLTGLLAFLVSCGEIREESLPKTQFTRVLAEDSGIGFSNQLVSTEDWNIIEYLYFYNGAGVAAGDINNDGLVDLFFTSNQGSNKLYLNKGAMKFTDVTDQAGLASDGWSTGVVMADVNGDGWLDIYVCQVGNYKGQTGRNKLYINQTNGTFKDEANAYGLDFSGLSTQVAFFDYDNDGDLDMYLLNHSVHGVDTYGPSSIREEQDPESGDRLFRNLSDEGTSTFVDVTQEAGIYSSQIGYGLGVHILDYNQDGFSDIYVSNDFHENDYLYENQGDGTFIERGQEAFGHTSRYSMGNDAGDINNDGLPEIITLDMLPTDPVILRKSAAEDRNEVSAIKAQYGYGPQSVRNGLQFNWGNGQFSDIAPFAGIFATDWSWAPLVGDLDNDGWNDIYITNGIAGRPNDLDYIQYFANTAGKGRQASDEELIEKMPQVEISNYLFRNSGETIFTDVTSDWGVSVPSYSHGSVFTDLDNDGDLDVVVNNVNAEAFIWENHTEELTNNHYLKIRLKHLDKNVNGIGTRIFLYSGGQIQYREVSAVHGFMSGAVQDIHFGLGDDPAVDSVVIFWPGFTRQTIREISTDTVVFIQSNGESYELPEEGPHADRKVEVQGLSDFVPVENKNFVDYQREHLIPYNLSSEGPAVAVGDVNGDSYDDVFIGGAHGVRPTLWIGGANGFELQRNTVWLDEVPYEDVDALFFDADLDGDQDLFIVSGGNQYAEGNFLLRDRLFRNDGQGQFSRVAGIPAVALNGSVVRMADVNGDGLPDLFVGARSVPGSYGSAPENIILVNRGGLQFEVFSGFKLKGMVSDAQWEDMDGDGDPDLVVAGDWMAVTIMENHGDEFIAHQIPESRGWWRSLEIIDLDKDGKPDILAGNMGLNHTLKTSPDEPVSLLLADFDDNGQKDPVILHYKSGIEIPFASKDELDKQVPAMKKEFTSYKAYADARNIREILTGMASGVLEERQLDTFAHMSFVNSGGLTFIGKALPDRAQWTCINDFFVSYAENDEVSILAAGNSLAGNTNLGPLDGIPLMELNYSEGSMHFTRAWNTPFYQGVAKSMLELNGRDSLLMIIQQGKSPIFWAK
ncbi:VCBS repeat-containing protein [Fulvivirga sedimenti]|uniref:VCBS repeat-containing protein n=1 Tax=Fulvivirga sedimenti TaxID=2879465 RepID=A0A9X1HVS7_9BACT|nr:VCBS repeat-containing protein [Fulvivirga sedimenti]MCA6079179.1 VCBS repeat-containing protein [Fulvivirga sedimenti]